MHLFSDNSRANSETRNHNLAILESAGFQDCGAKSSSGNLYIVELATKTKLVFGAKANISGRGGKVK